MHNRQLKEQVTLSIHSFIDWLDSQGLKEFYICQCKNHLNPEVLVRRINQIYFLEPVRFIRSPNNGRNRGYYLTDHLKEAVAYHGKERRHA